MNSVIEWASSQLFNMDIYSGGITMNISWLSFSLIGCVMLFRWQYNRARMYKKAAQG